MSLNSFRELLVWQKSFSLAKGVYVFAEQLPPAEKFGLTSQMQRSAVSIPSNIAEGQQRNNIREYRQFIGIARGSAAELETQLLLAGQIYNLFTEDLVESTHEIQKMLSGLHKKLTSLT